MTTSELNSKFRSYDAAICKIKRELAAGTSFPRVLNFAALPPFADNVDAVYIVEESQGIPYTPDWFGGAYKPKGFYYSNGIGWKYAGDFPFNATQPTVDAGLNNDQFITPLTLKNVAQWNDKANTSHTHVISDVTGLQTALDAKLSSVPAEYVTDLELVAELNDYILDTDPRLTDSRAPTAHTHPSTEITDFNEVVEDIIGTKVVAGSNITVTYNDLTGETEIASTGGGSTPLALWDFWNQTPFASTTTTPGGIFLGTALSSGTIAPITFSSDSALMQSYNLFGVKLRSSASSLSGYTFRAHSAAAFRLNSDSITLTCNFKLITITDIVFRFGISPAIGNTILSDTLGCVFDYNSNDGIVKLITRNSILSTFTPVAGSNYTCKIIYNPVNTTFVVWENSTSMPIVNITGLTGASATNAAFIGCHAIRHNTT